MKVIFFQINTFLVFLRPCLRLTDFQFSLVMGSKLRQLIKADFSEISKQLYLKLLLYKILRKFFTAILFRPLVEKISFFNFSQQFLNLRIQSIQNLKINFLSNGLSHPDFPKLEFLILRKLHQSDKKFPKFEKKLPIRKRVSFLLYI